MTRPVARLGAIALLLNLLAASVALTAPLPLTAEETAVLKAGAAAAKRAPGFGDGVAAASGLVAKLAQEGQSEALDLILAEESDYLLSVYLTNNFVPLAAADYERRVVENYEKPLLAVQLVGAMKTYDSERAYQLLQGDVKAYGAQRQDQAARCKSIITVISAPSQADLRYVSPPPSSGSFSVPSESRAGQVQRIICKDDAGQVRPPPSMLRAEMQLRDRHWRAIQAITRTNRKGIEEDLLQLLPGLSVSMTTEREGPAGQMSSLPIRHLAPPLNIVKLLGERGYTPAASQLASLLRQLLSEGPPYNVNVLADFAAALASLDTPEGSRAAEQALVAIAHSPETKLRNDAMVSLLDSLGEVLADAQVDLPALKHDLLPLVSEDKPRIERTFDTAIRSNAMLREPTADYVATLVARSNTLSKQARYCIEKMQNVNVARTTRGETLLNAAAGNLEAQKLLLSRGADPNLPGENGFTALHREVEAARRAQQRGEGIRLLLAQGANVNAAARDGATPLHVALARNEPDIAAILIAEGADVNAEDRRGTRPLTLAYERANPAVQTLIRERGGVESARDAEATLQREKARLEREQHITRRYAVRMLRSNGSGCEPFEMKGVCQRQTAREADEIEVVSNREMRLIFYSGKTLLRDDPAGRATERERYVAVVRDRAVAESYRSLQFIDWHNAGCNDIPGYGPYCWDERLQLCEKWGTQETVPCPSTIGTN